MVTTLRKTSSFKNQYHFPSLKMPNFRVSNSLLVLSVLAFLGSFISCCCCQVLFTFGDSLYDPGNKPYLTSDDVRATLWPYGQSIDRPNGRWSDGLIVPDFIAEFLVIKYIPPILNSKANFSNGAAFAVADATVLGTPDETMTLGDQVANFTGNKDRWTDEDRAKAIYMFYIGADDYLNFTKTHTIITAEQLRVFINQVIKGIEEALLVVYKAGGRKFAFQNLAPLGCLPIVKQDYKTGDKCLKLLTDIAAEHNDKLKVALEKLAKENAGFQYLIFDYFNATMRRMDDPFHYRYFSTKTACCGIGTHNAFGCGAKNVHSNLCTYQRASFYYDGRHNGEKANEEMAHLMFGADKSVVAPMNLRELLVLPGNLSMMES